MIPRDLRKKQKDAGFYRKMVEKRWNVMTENPLGYEKISKLLKSFAIPSIMATLIGSLYNIVDQIFIGQGVGYLGNAATNVCYRMVIGAIVNTILDPIFIFIFQWGIFGAALATILGQIISFLFAIRYLWHFKTIHFEKTSFLPNIKESLKTFSMGISSSVNQIAITFVQIILYNSLTYYGAQTVYGSDIPLAACGIVMKTNAIILAIVVGISQGVQPIIGFNYGAKQYSRVREAYLLAIKWNMIVSTIGFILLQCFPKYIISMFGTGDELYLEFAVLFMRIYLSWCW